MSTEQAMAYVAMAQTVQDLLFSLHTDPGTTILHTDLRILVRLPANAARFMYLAFQSR